MNVFIKKVTFNTSFRLCLIKIKFICYFVKEAKIRWALFNLTAMIWLCYFINKIAAMSPLEYQSFWLLDLLI